MGVTGTLIVGIILIVIIFIGLLIYFFRRIYAEKDEPRNEDIVINGLSNYSDGHGLGLIKEKKSNKEVTNITMSPRDIDYIKLKDKEYKLKEREIFVKNNLLIPLNFSNHRKIWLALTDRAEHLNDELKKHPFGKYIMAYIEDMHNNSTDNYIQLMQEKNNTILRGKTEGLNSAMEVTNWMGKLTENIAKKSVEQSPVKTHE